MRELKFRAWDKEKKKMFTVATLCLFDDATFDKGMDWQHNTQDWYGEEGFVVKPVLMQYTGLKDRHSAEIYEGDIVKFRDKIGSIVYCGDRFSIDDQENNLQDLHFFQHSWEVEVIGNIHQNPERLLQ